MAISIISIFGLLFVAFLGLRFLNRTFDFEGYFSGSKGLYTLLIFVMQWLLILAPILFLTIKKHGFKWSHFGFEKISIGKLLKAVAKAYLIYIGISIIIGMIILYSGVKIPGYQLQESIFQYFETDLISMIIAGFVITIVAPFIEEVLFRGFLLRSLVNRIGIIMGSIASALLFSVLHVPWQSVIPIFILGLIMNSIVISTKSIWPSIVFHSLNNSIAFTFAILIEKEVISVETLVISFS